MGPDVINREDIGMVPGRGRAGFLLEAPEPVRISGQRSGQHFQGDVAIESRVARLIDFAHPSGAQRGENLVRADAASGGDGHGAIRYRRSWAPVASRTPVSF